MKEVVEGCDEKSRAPWRKGSDGRYTTVGIGGPADIFVEATCRDDVAAVCRIAFETGTPMRVLGAGSTCSYRTGACGIVLHLGRRFRDIRFDGARVFAEAGATLPSREASSREGPVRHRVWRRHSRHRRRRRGDERRSARRRHFPDRKGSVRRRPHGRDGAVRRRRDAVFLPAEPLSGVYDSVVVGAVFELTPHNPDEIRHGECENSPSGGVKPSPLVWPARAACSRTRRAITPADSKPRV